MVMIQIRIFQHFSPESAIYIMSLSTKLKNLRERKERKMWNTIETEMVQRNWLQERCIPGKSRQIDRWTSNDWGSTPKTTSLNKTKIPKQRKRCRHELLAGKLSLLIRDRKSVYFNDRALSILTTFHSRSLPMPRPTQIDLMILKKEGSKSMKFGK